MTEWSVRVLVAIAFGVLMYVLGRRVSGLSRKQAAWCTAMCVPMFIGVSWYLGLRRAVILFAAGTAAGVLGALLNRWSPPSE